MLQFVHSLTCIQRREITYLRSQLNVVKNEKGEVMQRLNGVKDAARKAIASNSKR